MKKRLTSVSLIAAVVVFLFSIQEVYSQQIEAPVFFIGSSTTTILCVNQNFPDRRAIAKANVLFTSGTEFVLELSDENGLFSDATTRVLTRFTITTAIPPNGDIVFPFFPVPTDLRGENYSLRVNVPASSILSAVQENIPIYYFDSNSNSFTLNGPVVGLSSVALCEGESVTLTVIPANFPEYIWYFNADINDDKIENANVIVGESESTLKNVNQLGRYFVEINFGDCTRNFFLNQASIGVIEFNKTTVQINGPSQQSFCPSDVKILSTSITDLDFTYQWFKDGVLVPEFDGPSEVLPQSNFAGVYTVNVIGTETCSILTDPVEVINLGSDILTRPPPQIMILPTQTSLTLSITTNAPPTGSTIEWFRNGISFQGVLPITDPGALSVIVTDPGVYRASLFANDACMDTLEVTTEVFEPVGFKTVITNLFNCEEGTGSLGLENLFGITNTGVEVPITTDQYSFFDFEWFLGTQSTGVTETTFSVTEDNTGEVYALEATLRGTTLDTSRSNDLTVEFLGNSVVISASPSFIPFGENSTLSVPQSTSYTYEWFRVLDGKNKLIVDGNTNEGTITGQGTNAIVTNITGQYFVRITLGDCIIDSQPITISNVAGRSEIIPNVVTPNNDGINDNWLLPPSLFNQQDVEVTIYTSRGQVDYTSASYQNNWPVENSKSLGKDPLYYYIITKNNSVVRKGSITVMR